MTHGASQKLFDHTPPAWLRKVEVAMLMNAFADAFDVEPPTLKGMSADDALAAYREFTAACMEAALADDDVAAAYRARLGVAARELGRKVRFATHVRPANAFRLARFFYRGIGIELSGELLGSLRFGPCSFAQRYTPADCWFMSAFDEGFMCGIAGLEGELCFECRLTEGAACCCARLE